MARFRTTKIQISGYRLSVRRYVEAIIRRDTRLLDSPFASQTSAWAFGCFIIVIFAVAGLIMGFFKPAAGLASDAGYAITKDGGQYVYYGEAWHPVTNAVSASLILGNPVQAGKVVKDDAFKDVRLGLPMGLGSAPATMATSEDEKAPITVCSTHIPPDPLAEDDQTIIETSVVIGNELNRGTTLEKGKSVLVTVYDKSRYWLLFEGKRAQLDMSDDVVLAALNISADVIKDAVVVSPKLLDAIPAAPSIAVPVLSNEGSTSQNVTGMRVGDILVQEMPNEPSAFYVVAYEGVQMIPETVARILTTNGSQIIRNPSAGIISAADKVEAVNLSYYPRLLPDFETGDTVCSTWDKGSENSPAETTFKVSEGIPIADKKREEMSPTISGGDGPSTDRYYAGKAGKGWFVRATDLNDETITEGTMYFISSDGIRYPIGADKEGNPSGTLQALGLTEKPPFMVPWQYLTLIPEGATLSQDQALVLHETITPPAEQLSPNEIEQEGESS